MPANSNKVIFIIDLLNGVRNEFEKYIFINRTSSPMQAYSYIERQGYYYRKMNDMNYISINTDEYVEAYRKERLHDQGISLNEYVEMIILFELEHILMCLDNNDAIDKIPALVNILICPDGLNEIHIYGESELVSDIVKYLRRSRYKLTCKK